MDPVRLHTLKWVAVNLVAYCSVSLLSDRDAPAIANALFNFSEYEAEVQEKKDKRNASINTMAPHQGIRVAIVPARKILHWRSETPNVTRRIRPDVPKVLKLHVELEEDLERIRCQRLLHLPWDALSELMLFEVAHVAGNLVFQKHAV